MRYFRSTINGYTIDYNYEPYLLTLGGDGDAISFPVTGGAASAYFNNGCVPPPSVLPITLLNFSGNCEVITWQTATEINVNRFEIYRSYDAINYELIHTENAAGNSSTPISYSFSDNDNYDGNIYYRLKSIDNDGFSEFFSPIVVNCDLITDVIIYPNPSYQGQTLKVAGDVYNIQIFDIVGREIVVQIINNEIKGLSNGVYIIQVNGKYQFKIIIQ